MKTIKSKIYITGVSISLALALAACGGSDTNVSQSGVQTLSSNISLETKASSTLENPLNLSVVNIEESNATLEFDGFKDAALYASTEGIAIVYGKLPSDLIEESDSQGYKISDDNETDIPEEFWEKIQLGWGVKTLATDADANRTQFTITDLVPNQLYAFRIASIVDDNTTLSLYSGSGEWSEIVTQGKTLAGIPSPEVTAKSACLYDYEECTWKYGVQLNWKNPKMLDTVNIYREELNSEDNSSIEGSFQTLATELHCIYKYDDTETEEGHVYRYTVEGYNLETGIYADKNVTVDVTVESI